MLSAAADMWRFSTAPPKSGPSSPASCIPGQARQRSPAARSLPLAVHQAGRTSLIADQLPGCRPAGRPPAVRPVTIDLRTKNTHRYADNRPGRPRAPARRLSGVSRLPSPHGLAHSLLAGSRKDILVSRQESLAPLCLTAHTAWSLRSSDSGNTPMSRCRSNYPHFDRRDRGSRHAQLSYCHKLARSAAMSGRSAPLPRPARLARGGVWPGTFSWQVTTHQAGPPATEAG